jgi:ketosteroid isomerase-like protein
MPMKGWNLLILALLAVSPAPGDCGSPPAPEGRSRIERELLAVEAAWDDAIVRKDRAALEGIIAEDFILVGTDGRVSNRSEMLDAVLSSDLHIEPFETRDVRVRIYGKVAVLTGWFVQHGTFQGRAYETSSRYTDVYVKRGGKWRGVLAHATRLPRPSGD